MATKIKKYDVPLVLYWENEEKREQLDVSIDILLKMGDLMVKRTDGTLAPIICVSCQSSTGDGLIIDRRGIFDTNGELVKIVPPDID